MAKVCYTKEERENLAFKIKKLKEDGFSAVEIASMLSMPPGTVCSLLSTFFKPKTTYERRGDVDIKEIEAEKDSKLLDEKSTQLWQTQSEGLESLAKRVETIEQGLVKVFQRDEELQRLLNTLAKFFRE